MSVRTRLGYAEVTNHTNTSVAYRSKGCFSLMFIVSQLSPGPHYFCLRTQISRISVWNITIIAAVGKEIR